MVKPIARPAAVVMGASGGIGHALAQALVARGDLDVHAWSRRGEALPGARVAAVDLQDEAAIARAAAGLGEAPLTCLLVATGLLHKDGVRPERALSELDGAALSQLFAVNAIGPALLFKRLAPRLPRRGRATVAMLSARVGSLGDNRLGGWYGYRASKAALNMLIRTAAVELARTRPEALVVGLHPGTVDTPLSAPFQARAPHGRLRSPEWAAADLLIVLDRLEPSDSGGVFAYDGERLPD